MLRLRTAAATLVIVATISAFSSPVTQAQQLESGTWFGLMMPPGGSDIAITLEVTSTSDSLGIRLIVGQQGSFDLNEIEYSEDKLTFTFSVGQLISCELKKKANGSFEGPCSDPSGEEGLIIMNPPKKD